MTAPRPALRSCIDGHTLYTPGLSQSLGGVSSYYDFDRLGNLWTVDGTSKNQLEYEDFTGFGSIIAQAGSVSPYAFGGGNGCQSDADTGLVLMGHRYYDSRQGRFLSQDPAGAGNNWYAYAGNNPVNKTDPSGLTPMDGPGSSPMGSPGYGGIGDGAGYAENFMSDESSRDNYNQGVDIRRSINTLVQASMQEWMPQTANSETTIMLWDDPFAEDALSGIVTEIAGAPWVRRPVPTPENPHDWGDIPFATLFGLSKQDWHDIFTEEAEIGGLETLAGGIVSGVNKTAMNPGYIRGVNSAFGDRNGYAAAVGGGLALGGVVSIAIGTAGAYLTR